MLDEIIDLSAAQLESRLMTLLCHNAECVLENGFLDIPQEIFDKVDDANRKLLHRPPPVDHAFFKFQEDFEGYNEDLTSIAPVYGVKTQIAMSMLRDRPILTNSKSVENTIGLLNSSNDGGHDDDIFELEMEDKQAKGKEKLTWTTVTGSRTNNEHVGNRSSPKIGTTNSPNIWNSMDRESTSPKMSPKQSWTTAPRGSIPSSPKPWQSPSLDKKSPNNSGGSSFKTPVRRFSATSTSSWQNSKKSPAEYSQKSMSPPGPSSLTSMFAASMKSSNNYSPTQSPNQLSAVKQSSPQTSAAPVTYITPEITELPTGKMSQKERRKLQRGRTVSTGTASTSSPAWSIPSTSTPPKTAWNAAKPAGSGNNVEDSPFALYKTPRKSKEEVRMEEPSLTKPTLADIIRQEQHNVQKQAWQSTRSLKDIQQEEEFQKWWSKESQKMQGAKGSDDIGSNKENSSSLELEKHNKRKHRPRKTSKPQTAVGV
jgi:hypothetical protein